MASRANKRQKLISGESKAIVTAKLMSVQVLDEAEAQEYFGDTYRKEGENKFSKPIFATDRDAARDDIVWVRTEGKGAYAYFKPYVKIDDKRASFVLTLVDENSSLETSPVHCFGSELKFKRWGASFTIRCSDKKRRELMDLVEKWATAILEREGAALKRPVLFLSNKTSPFYGRSAYLHASLQNKYMSATYKDKALDMETVPSGDVTKRLDLNVSVWLNKAKSEGGVDFAVKNIAM